MLNKLIAIMRKDTILRFQSRSELLFFLVLPIIFTVIVSRSISSDVSDSRVVLPVVDGDGGARAAALLAELAKSGTVRPEVMSAGEAEAQLANNEVGAALIIPAGFSAATAAGDEAQVTLRAAPGSNLGPAVELEVRAAAGAVTRPALIARNAAAALDSVAGAEPLTGEARAAFLERAEAAAAAEVPPSRVEFSTAGEESDFDIATHTSVGQLLTWVFIPLLGVSSIFAFERALGTLRRLMITPTRKSTFLLGTIGGQLIAALFQMAVLILFGVYVLRVPWGDSPGALALVLVTFALAGLALGTMLGTFVKTEGQAINLSILFGMVMSMLGGAWFPMEIFPTGMQQAVKVLPTTWAMQGLTDLAMRGGGLNDILPEAAVLLGFAVVFFAVGVWRFRYE